MARNLSPGADRTECALDNPTCSNEMSLGYGPSSALDIHCRRPSRPGEGEGAQIGGLCGARSRPLGQTSHDFQALSSTRPGDRPSAHFRVDVAQERLLDALVVLMASADDTFDAFLTRVGPRVHRALVAAYGVRDGREAAQDALAWAWENWPRVQSMRNPAGYLFRVGQTAAKRSRPRDLVVSSPMTDSIWMDAVVDHNLMEALDRLPDRQRVAVVLVHGHGYTFREAAELLDVNPSTVRIHLQRALAKLRHLLEVDHVG